MILSIFIISVSIASIGTIWKSLIRDIPSLKNFLKRVLPSLVSQAVFCGFCMTFWISLFTVLIFNPLASWVLPFRFPISNLFVINFFHFIFSWMTIGGVAWFFRFLFDELYDLIHIKNHALKKETGHP